MKITRTTLLTIIFSFGFILIFIVFFDEIKDLFSCIEKRDYAKTIFQGVIAAIIPLLVFWLSKKATIQKEEREKKQKRFEMRENLLVSLNTVASRSKLQVNNITKFVDEMSNLNEINLVPFISTSTYATSLFNYNFYEVWDILRHSREVKKSNIRKEQLYCNFVVNVEFQKDIEQELINKHCEMRNEFREFLVNWNATNFSLINHFNKSGNYFNETDSEYYIYQNIAKERIFFQTNLTQLDANLLNCREKLANLLMYKYNEYIVESVEKIEEFRFCIQQWKAFHKGYIDIFNCYKKNLIDNQVRLDSLTDSFKDEYVFF